MLGMAGGVFIVPILTLIFGLDIKLAIGASLVSAIASSCSSAAPYLREGLANVRLAMVLEIATTLGALCGVFLIGWLSTSFLYGLFAAILLLSAKQMYAHRGIDSGSKLNELPNPGSVASRLKLHSSYLDRASGEKIGYTVGSLPFGIVLMYGAGLVSALLGIGSGVLKIPAMDTALRLPIKVSSATSNFMIGVTGSASAAAYFMHGMIDLKIAGSIAMGSVLGAVMGARLLIRLSSEKLRMFFVGILLLLALGMLYECSKPFLAGGGI